MPRLEVPVTRIGGSYIQDGYKCSYNAFVRVCKEALNRFFVIRVGPYYPNHLIFVFDTDKPEGSDWLAMFPQEHGGWYDLRLEPHSLYCDTATYPNFDNWMNKHFFRHHVVYAWVEFPDESDK